MNTGVYMIEHTASGKKYIGSAGRSFKSRWGVHRGSLRNGTHHSVLLQRAWNKYGEDAFEFRVVKRTTPKEAVDSEQAFIDLHQTCDPKHGYNIAPIAGSSLGRKHTAETLAKMSVSQKGNKNGLGFKHTDVAKAKMSASQIGHKRCLGVKHTDAAKANMSLALMGNKNSLGRKHSDEALAKIGAASKGRKHTNESILKMSAAKMGNSYAKKEATTCLARD